jgi:chromosome segregation ATPase
LLKRYKKHAVFLFKAGKIYNLNGRSKISIINMLSEEQIKKLVSANESLQIQLDDANAILAAREQEIDFLSNELADATALRSKLDGQQDEIESIQSRLGEKLQAAKGAEEREIELHQELSEMARLNKQYNELVQDYAYLSSRYNDVQESLSPSSESRPITVASPEATACWTPW